MLDKENGNKGKRNEESEWKVEETEPLPRGGGFLALKPPEIFRMKETSAGIPSLFLLPHAPAKALGNNNNVITAGKEALRSFLWFFNGTVNVAPVQIVVLKRLWSYFDW